VPGIESLQTLLGQLKDFAAVLGRTATGIKILVFCVVTACGLLDTTVSEESAASFLRVEA